MDHFIATAVLLAGINAEEDEGEEDEGEEEEGESGPIGFCCRITG